MKHVRRRKYGSESDSYMNYVHGISWQLSHTPNKGENAIDVSFIIPNANSHT
jgi:hypothetical protein